MNKYSIPHLTINTTNKHVAYLFLYVREIAVIAGDSASAAAVRSASTSHRGVGQHWWGAWAVQRTLTARRNRSFQSEVASSSKVYRSTLVSRVKRENFERLLYVVRNHFPKKKKQIQKNKLTRIVVFV